MRDNIDGEVCQMFPRPELSMSTFFVTKIVHFRTSQEPVVRGRIGDTSLGKQDLVVVLWAVADCLQLDTAVAVLVTAMKNTLSCFWFVSQFASDKVDAREEMIDWNFDAVQLFEGTWED